jgi:ligand-binding SRPBCC domain-containing protein
MNPKRGLWRNATRMVIHTINRTLTVHAPLAECWSFFSNPRNLARITPPNLGLHVPGDVPDEMHAGLMIEYRVRPLFGFQIVWLTEITHVDQPRYFVDEQRVGPYRIWHHEHRFYPVDSDRTEVLDTIHYVLPLSPISEIIHGVTVEPKLRQIFEYRERVIRELFGESR